MILTLATPARDRIIEPMITLAHCSKQDRIVVAGSRGIELMFELQRLGYVRAAATPNCGHPAAQYDVALVDWRRRTFNALEPALDWLVAFLRPNGVLVVWVGPQKAAANQALRQSLERRGFVIHAGNRPEGRGPAFARRGASDPVRKAARPV